MSWRQADLDAADREVLQRYVDAHERGDAATIVAMLADGIGITMPPEPACLGIDAATAFFETLLTADRPDEWRLVVIAANGQPAIANYRRRSGEAGFWALSVDVLDLIGGEIVTVNCFLGKRPSPTSTSPWNGNRHPTEVPALDNRSPSNLPNSRASKVRNLKSSAALLSVLEES